MPTVIFFFLSRSSPHLTRAHTLWQSSDCPGSIFMPGINNNSYLLPLQGCFAHIAHHLPIWATKSLLGDYSDIILAVACEWGGWMGLNPLCHTEITFVTRVPGRPIHRLVDCRLFRMWNGFGSAACLFSKNLRLRGCGGRLLESATAWPRKSAGSVVYVNVWGQWYFNVLSQLSRPAGIIPSVSDRKSGAIPDLLASG